MRGNIVLIKQMIRKLFQSNQKAEHTDSGANRVVDSFEELQKNASKRQKLAEYGRSMVEILGVLAVIGVLSVGGIMGYRYAMEKYRSNDIVYEVNLRATDVWHRYQEMPLPYPNEDEETDFPEYPTVTGTGFPIYMESKPDVAVKIYVEEVSPRICRQVLNMPLIDVIKGLQFVQVNDVKYTGDVGICGDMNGSAQNEMVFTIFLNSESDSLINENCVEESDCSSCCGTPVCNGDTLTCEDACTGNASRPYCLQESCSCVECLEPSDCASKGSQYTCSEITHTCERIEEACVDGEEFRTPNGVCVPCDNPNNFLVSKTIYENPALGFRDGKSGLEQCALCQNPTRYSGDVDDDTSYCSYACTNGYSYQALSEGCISCTDKTPHKITGDTVSKAQCLACGEDRFWYQENFWGGSYYCAVMGMCQSDGSTTEKTFHPAQGTTCVSCDASGSYYLNGSIISPNAQNYFTESCNDCGNRSVRSFFEGKLFCIKNCEQPQGAPEKCDDPENCNRVWQNTGAQCLPCNDTSGNNKVYTHDTISRELCTACGRKIVETGGDEVFCVYEQECGLGYFNGKDGKCHACSENRYVAVSDDDTTCETNCKQNGNGEYDVNGSIDTRWKGNFGGSNPISSWPQPEGAYCLPKCKDNYAQVGFYYGASCESCTANNNEIMVITEDECDRCSNRELYYVHGMSCSVKNCPEGGPYGPYYKNRMGKCVLCSRENSGDDDFLYGEDGPGIATELCLACGNRISAIAGSNRACRKVDPGRSGICSSLDGPAPSQLNSDLKDKAKPYLDGEKDGELFLANDGYCYRCDDKTASPAATSAQCASCGNRRMSNGRCQYGKCEAKKQFLGANNNCYDCSQKNIAVNPNEENLCSSCDNRREMTLGNASLDTLTAKCVEECTPGLWQDSNGNCLLCGEGGNRAIGTDSTSVSLCNACDNREAVATTDSDGNITGYMCNVKI